MSSNTLPNAWKSAGLRRTSHTYDRAMGGRHSRDADPARRRPALERWRDHRRLDQPQRSHDQLLQHHHPAMRFRRKLPRQRQCTGQCARLQRRERRGDQVHQRVLCDLRQHRRQLRHPERLAAQGPERRRQPEPHRQLRHEHHAHELHPRRLRRLPQRQPRGDPRSELRGQPQSHQLPDRRSADFHERRRRHQPARGSDAREQHHRRDQFAIRRLRRLFRTAITRRCWCGIA